MRVMLFFLEFALPICVLFWMVVDLVIPAFTKALDKKSETKEYGKFFWFIGSIFAGKPKKTFEEEIGEAERAFKDAKTKMEKLKSSATAETKEAKEHLSKAEKIFDDAKTKLEILKGGWVSGYSGFSEHYTGVSGFSGFSGASKKKNNKQ